MMGKGRRLENEGGLKSRRNEQVTGSVTDIQEVCVGSSAVVGEGGGGSQSPAYPSFLVLL